MNVQQLISELEKIQDKARPVFFWEQSHRIFEVSRVDDTLTDRVDLATE